jgi:hypothetical protein
LEKFTKNIIVAPQPSIEELLNDVIEELR